LGDGWNGRGTSEVTAAGAASLGLLEDGVVLNPALLPTSSPRTHNGDGKSGIQFQNSGGRRVWELNGASVIGGGSLGNPGPSWHPIGTGDVNGDGRADILWQNSSGEVVVWELNGASVIGGGSLGNPGPSWHAVGSGDFNGGGRADILFENSTGEVVIWELNGTSVIGAGSLGNPGPGWHAVATGDFNGDGCLISCSRTTAKSISGNSTARV
jgi:hypothetical protein